ncbi:MAG: hypothetical protein AAGU76_18615 [Sedimentibacter sp.]|uniref:hypothetical protein n=1 Tax=Sedimentibacter sp. TaxID=1960295 RepID=UPI00315915AE
MKDFIAVFIMCFVACVVVTFFFGGFILENIWGAFFVVSLVLSIIANGFINQDSRINELEKKIEQLMKEKQD